MFAMIDSRC